MGSCQSIEENTELQTNMVNLLKENGFTVEGMIFMYDKDGVYREIMNNVIVFTCKKDGYTFKYRMGRNGYNTKFLENHTNILHTLDRLKKEYGLVFDIKQINIRDKDQGYSSSTLCTEKGTMMEIIYRSSYYFLWAINDEYRAVTLSSLANAIQRKEKTGLFMEEAN